MPSRAPAQQGSLFPEPQGSLLQELDEPPPESFVEEKRCELNATLRLVQGAERMPWDILELIHAERRFISISRWLPEAEGARLRELFGAELVRLYAVEGWTGEDEDETAE